MNGWLKVGLPVAAAAVFMGVTNPKPEEYSTYAVDRLASKGAKVMCSQLSICGTGKIPKPLEAAAHIAMKPAINATTTRRNLLVFSLYRTDMPGVGTMKSVGILGKFFTYSGT